MRPRIGARFGLAFLTALGLLTVSACHTQTEPEATPASPTPTPSTPISSAPAPASLKNEIPPAELEKVMAAHFRGLGSMEQYSLSLIHI